jgi:hypothetical protein
MAFFILLVRPPSKHVTLANPLKTLFVARLNFDTTEGKSIWELPLMPFLILIIHPLASLKTFFEEYGKVSKVTLICNYGKQRYAVCAWHVYLTLTTFMTM